MWTLGALVALLSGYWIWEYLTHRARLERVPIRIHVNGTRGKSSVVRLVHGALRAGGIRAVAKTTGAVPTYIDEVGREHTIRRMGRASIREQLAVMARASRSGAEAMVIECMALQPALQWLSEHRMISATTGIVTNARADHLDVMGPTSLDVARALAGTAPDDAPLYTAETNETRLGPLREAAERGGGRVEVVVPSSMAVTEAEMTPFSYLEHEENVALALAVAMAHGVTREAALRGMYEATPDPGALSVRRLEFFHKEIVFLNGFSANDPDSSTMIWERALARFSSLESRVLVVNARSDRPDRSRQMGELMARRLEAHRYVLVGTGTEIVLRTALGEGLHHDRIVVAEGWELDRIFEVIIAPIATSGLVVGFGNVKGTGADLDRFFANRTRRT